MKNSALKVLSTAAFAAIAASTAFAADMAPRYTKAPPPVVEVWNWTGFYIGGNAGYSWGRTDTSVDFYNTTTGATIVLPPGSINSARFNMDGAIAGGQLGYNWQSSNWVFGLEADLQWSDEKGRAAYLCASTGVAGGVCFPGVTAVPAGTLGTALTYAQHLQWFGTVRGRAGVSVTPQTLLYVTGGLAYGSIKTTASITSTNAAQAVISAVGSNTDTRIGWTVGAGAEFMLNRNWSAKIEYLYMDLGDFNNINFTLAPLAPIGVRTSSNFPDHIARVGINYRWGGPVVAKY
jgi:outer membrane immunogenic protein